MAPRLKTTKRKSAEEYAGAHQGDAEEWCPPNKSFKAMGTGSRASLPNDEIPLNTAVEKQVTDIQYQGQNPKQIASTSKSNEASRYDGHHSVNPEHNNMVDTQTSDHLRDSQDQDKDVYADAQPTGTYAEIHGFRRTALIPADIAQPGNMNRTVIKDTDRRLSHGDVLSMDKRLGDRGRANPNKSRAAQHTRTFECIRTLIRMGILPAIAAFDDVFLKCVTAVVQHHDMRFPQLVGGPKNLDPFAEIRIREADGKVRLPTAVSILDRVVSEKYANSQVVWNSLMSAGRPAMYEMARKLLGPQPEQHQGIVAKSFDAWESITSGQIRTLLIKELGFTSANSSAPLPKSADEFHERCIFGLKLLCIVYAGMIAIFKSSWNESLRMQSYQSRLIPDMYAKLSKFEAEWSVDSIRTCLFQPTRFLDAADPATVCMPLIATHLERLCTVQLDSIVQMTTSDVSVFRGLCETSLANNSMTDVQTITSLLQNPGVRSQTTSDDRKSENPRKRWDYQREEPFPWNKHITWCKYRIPILPVGKTDGSMDFMEITPISAYERDFRLINDSKDYMLHCHIKNFSLAGIQATNTNDEAIERLICEMLRMVLKPDELPCIASQRDGKQQVKEDALMSVSNEGVVSLWRQKLNTQMSERNAASAIRPL
jgi:hypothetical protein